MREIFLLLILCLPLSANRFNGFWIGKGRAIGAGGSLNLCEYVLFEIVQSTDRIHFKRGEYKCLFLNGRWEQMNFKIRKGDLFHENKLVGKVTPTELSFTRNKGILASHFILDRSGLNFSERYASAQGWFIYRLDAHLNRTELSKNEYPLGAK